MTNAAVTVVRTGVANLASVMQGLHRAGASAVLSDDAATIARAERLVLPGVGSFGAARSRLRQLGLDQSLVDRISEGRSTLAICLGLQLLGGGSDETPSASGLNAFDERAIRFNGCVSVPQIGWNAVSPDAGCRLIQAGYAYFANSYRLVSCPSGWSAAWSDHGGRFIAALERGDVLACQFHPELSGAWGIGLLRAWLTRTPQEQVSC